MYVRGLRGYLVMVAGHEVVMYELLEPLFLGTAVAQYLKGRGKRAAASRVDGD